MKFAQRTNNFANGEWRRLHATVLEDCQAFLGRMNGIRPFSLLLWRLPDNEDVELAINREIRKEGPSTFIQAAGKASALCVEVRIQDDSGPRGHWSVGRQGEATEPLRTVTWAVEQYKMEIPNNELFTADQAALVFEQYLINGGFLDWEQWTLRPTFADSSSLAVKDD